MLSRIIGLCFVLLAFTVSTAFAGDDVPPWMQQAAAARPPVYEKEVPAVVLHNEQIVTVGSDGKVTTVRMYAVRILTREGRGYARAVELYLTDAGKVREMRAWLIRPNGDIKKYGKDETVDVISDPNDIYNEYRLKSISAVDEADAGMVFGYQVTSEEMPLFSQDTWRFQARLPTLLSRYTLALPAGWRATSVTFNRDNIEPTTSGTTYTWELRNLPPIEPEPASPQVTNLAPRIAVNYFPAEVTASARSRSFDSWVEVSRWGSEMHDPQAAPDEALAARARQLTANSKTDLERIRAIGRFVQELQYISVDIGVGRGNGFRPRPASQVFAKLYGDCKDKANLMRAMLKAVNISSYPVAVYSGDRTYVRQEWASPGQFNHCIIAIKVGEDTQVATVITDPNLGRLLIFDATDDNTMAGDLPDDEQGSLALIMAGDKGSLVRLPVLPPETNRLDRESDVSLAEDGSITATVRERAMGQRAADYRREFRGLSRPQYTGLIERWVTRGANGAKVTRIEPKDDRIGGDFALDIEFNAKSYGQLMQNRLLVFKPAVIDRLESLTLTEAKRKQPVVLESQTYTETVRVTLPDGFEVDEMPDPMKLSTGFGSFTATYEMKDGQLVFVRTLTQRAQTIPVEQYDAVRNFYANIRSAEQSPVVLARK